MNSRNMIFTKGIHVLTLTCCHLLLCDPGIDIVDNELSTDSIFIENPSNVKPRNFWSKFNLKMGGVSIFHECLVHFFKGHSIFFFIEPNKTIGNISSQYLRCRVWLNSFRTCGKVVIIEFLFLTKEWFLLANHCVMNIESNRRKRIMLVNTKLYITRSSDMRKFNSKI